MSLTLQESSDRLEGWLDIQHGTNVFLEDLEFNEEKTRVTLNIHMTALNVLNHPVWSTGPIPAAGGPGLNFLNDSNITSTTFGQVAQPLSSARRILLRTEVRF